MDEETRLIIKDRLKNLESGFANVFRAERKPIIGGNDGRKPFCKRKKAC